MSQIVAFIIGLYSIKLRSAISPIWNYRNLGIKYDHFMWCFGIFNMGQSIFTHMEIFHKQISKVEFPMTTGQRKNYNLFLKLSMVPYNEEFQ